MSRMPYAIVVSSQKGGVGKTTVSVNLATALRLRGYKVLLVDTDYANPSVAFHLGVEDVNIGLRSVLKGKVSLAKATLVHHPTDMHVLPGEVTAKSVTFTSQQFNRLAAQVSRLNYDFVIFDMAPGPLPTETSPMFKKWKPLEILILITPEMSACVSAIRLRDVYEMLRIPRQFVATRIKNRRYELHISEIEDVCGERMLTVLPEDEAVPISIAQHTPAYLFDRRAKFSAALGELARHYSSKTNVEPEVLHTEGRGFWAFLRYVLSFFRG